MEILMLNFIWNNQISISDIIASLALLISLTAFIWTWRVSAKEDKNTKYRNRTEAEKLLDEALDLMNRGKAGTESLFINFHEPPSPETRAFFESARRKISEAIRLSPDFYLCYHYESIYIHRMEGESVEEKANNALKINLRAVKLWEKDKDPRVKDDGWPYHDLAVIYGHLGKYKEAEHYYQKAIKINPLVPEFYKDFAELHKRRGDLEKYKELFERSEKISQKTGRDIHQKDIL
jgi:tetratricopeptide (TPR) repeat protein